MLSSAAHRHQCRSAWMFGEMRALKQIFLVVFLTALMVLFFMANSLINTQTDDLHVIHHPDKYDPEPWINHWPDHCSKKSWEPSRTIPVEMYPNYDVSRDPDAFIQEMHSKYPSITSVYEIGKSVQGRPLTVLVISDNPKQHEIREPEMKLMGALHGNELVGLELLAAFARLLLENYCSDLELTQLVDSTRIHILLSANPDGRVNFVNTVGRSLNKAVDKKTVEKYGRENANNKDLNRDFIFDGDFDSPKFSQLQKETQLLIKWMQESPFVLSMVYHGGSKLVVYPYDDVKTPVPDIETFKFIAENYVESNPGMRGGYPCPKEYPKERFPGGHISGANWYALKGGMQDVNYKFSNCLELTIEVSCLKVPPARDLPAHWEDNRQSLVSLLHMAHIGLKGLVTDDETGTPLDNCVIKVDGIGHDITCTAIGEYWRLLAPGTYKVTVSSQGYTSKTASVKVPARGGINIDFQLTKES